MQLKDIEDGQGLFYQANDILVCASRLEFQYTSNSIIFSDANTIQSLPSPITIYGSEFIIHSPSSVYTRRYQSVTKSHSGWLKDMHNLWIYVRIIFCKSQHPSIQYTCITFKHNLRISISDHRHRILVNEGLARKQLMGIQRYTNNTKSKSSESYLINRSGHTLTPQTHFTFGAYLVGFVGSAVTTYACASHHNYKGLTYCHMWVGWTLFHSHMFQAMMEANHRQLLSTKTINEGTCQWCLQKWLVH